MLKKIVKYLCNNKKSVLFYKRVIKGNKYGMIEKIKSKLKQNRLPLLLVLILVGFFAFWDFAFAADNAWADTAWQISAVEWIVSKAGGFINTFLDVIVTTLTLVYNMWTYMILAFVYLVGWFLSPDFYTWDIAWLRNFFNEIWVIISNFVYLFFAWLLIWIAFVNIIWREGSNYQLKTVLPKFVLSVLIVPFTKFIVSFTLSFVTIASQAILTLPGDLITSDKFEGEITPMIFNYENLNKVWVDALRKDLEAPKISIKKDLANNPYLIVWQYFDWVVALPYSENISEDDFKQNVTKFIINALFAVVFIFSCFGLLLVLIYRIIWIWIYTIFSPLFAVSFFFWGEGWLKKISISQFLSTAFVPVYVSLALSFGFIFIAKLSDSSTYSEDSPLIPSDSDASGTSYNNWDYILKIKWDIFNNFDAWTKMAGGVVDSGQDFLIKLFIQIFWIVIFRIAMMAALRKDELTSTVIEPIANVGKSFWNAVTSLPKYSPLIWGVSVHWLETLSGYPMQLINSNSNRRASIIKDELKGRFWARSAIDDVTMSDMIQILNDKSSTPKELEEVMDLIVSTQKEYGKDDVSLKKLKNAFFETLEKNKKQSYISAFIGKQSVNNWGVKATDVFYKDWEITQEGYRLLLKTQVSSEVLQFKNTSWTRKVAQNWTKDYTLKNFKDWATSANIRSNIKTDWDSSEIIFYDDYKKLNDLKLSELQDDNNHVVATKDKVTVYGDSSLVILEIGEDITKSSDLNTRQIKQISNLEMSDRLKVELLNKLWINITVTELDKRIKGLGSKK